MLADVDKRNDGTGQLKGFSCTVSATGSGPILAMEGPETGRIAGHMKCHDK